MSKYEPYLDEEEELLIELPPRPYLDKSFKMNSEELKAFVDLHSRHNLPFNICIRSRNLEEIRNRQDRIVTISFYHGDELLVQWAEELARFYASSYSE